MRVPHNQSIKKQYCFSMKPGKYPLINFQIPVTWSNYKLPKAATVTRIWRFTITVHCKCREPTKVVKVAANHLAANQQVAMGGVPELGEMSQHPFVSTQNSTKQTSSSMNETFRINGNYWKIPQRTKSKELPVWRCIEQRMIIIPINVKKLSLRKLHFIFFKSKAVG